MTTAQRKTFSSSRGNAFGSLTQLFEDVFWAWGTTRFFPGATFPRNMTIVREGDSLVVVHPVMMPPEEQARVEALGRIAHIVRLGDFHGMDDALYQEKYNAELWAPRGATFREGTRVDHELFEGGPTPFSDGAAFAFDVSRSPEMVIHLRRHDGMLLTCDSVQNWEHTAPGCSWLGALMAKPMGFRGRACIGPMWRKQNEPRDGTGFGPKFRSLLQLDVRHIVSAHGPPLKDTAQNDLQAAVDKLYPA